jgi:hypothetical protein
VRLLCGIAMRQRERQLKIVHLPLTNGGLSATRDPSPGPSVAFAGGA